MLSRTERALLTRLRRRRPREAEGLFLAEGVRVVEELLASPLAVRLAVVADELESRGERERALVARLAARARVERVAAHELSRLAPTETPQGAVVVAETPRPALDSLRPAARATVLVLDAVQDPGNAGTVIRSAAAFGVAAVLALPGTVDAWNPKAVRASAGTVFRLPIVECDWPALSAWLTAGDFALYGAEVGGAPVATLPRRPREALVLGNEGAGLSDAVSARLDARVAVPMRAGVESLNVAVAAGILLYLLTAD